MTGRGISGLVAILVLLVGLAYYFTSVNPVLRYVKQGLDLQGGVQVVLQATKPVTAADMQKVETIIAFRANGFGVSSPVIQIQNQNQIVAQLPGIKNQQQAITALGQTAQLEFKGPKGQPILSGADLVSAQAALAGTGGSGAVINLTFDAAGTKAFATATQAYLHQPISIYLDGKNIETATVQAVITNGNAQITGIGTLQQAQTLATLLSSGALPVPLKIIEATAVSATLGASSIHASEIAGLVAMALIGLFMVAAYRLAGFLADMALVFYLMLFVGVLVALGFVMTLPAVAGVILSAGIAVDANVIIFARVREELRSGLSMKTALDKGFRNAFRAILDSNVSTIIAAIVLYYFGSGDVRGFAVTLGLGVAISFLTAIVFTRYLLRLAEDSVLVGNLKVFLG